MYNKIAKCPNLNCKHHKGSTDKFYIKKGKFKTKYNHQWVNRYKCKSCGRNFSSHSFKDTFRQHKPYVNIEIFKLINSGVTLRRIAKILNIAKKTVERKFNFLAQKSLILHEKFILSGEMNTSYVQFDEMETLQGNKKRPLSISLAIRAKTGQIIDARVAKMRLKGRLAKKYLENIKYWNEDNRKEITKNVFKVVKVISKENITIASDMKKSYPNIIKSIIPNAEIKVHKRRVEKKEFDPMFRLNHIAAKIRADLSRMRRRTWAITKKWQNLQKHLYIYIAWNNGYEMN